MKELRLREDKGLESGETKPSILFLPRDSLQPVCIPTGLTMILAWYALKSLCFYPYSATMILGRNPLI